MDEKLSKTVIYCCHEIGPMQVLFNLFSRRGTFRTLKLTLNNLNIEKLHFSAFSWSPNKVFMEPFGFQGT
jgi:hypothetical protein